MCQGNCTTCAFTALTSKATNFVNGQQFIECAYIASIFQLVARFFIKDCAYSTRSILNESPTFWNCIQFLNIFCSSAFRISRFETIQQTHRYTRRQNFTTLRWVHKNWLNACSVHIAIRRNCCKSAFLDSISVGTHFCSFVLVFQFMNRRWKLDSDWRRSMLVGTKWLGAFREKKRERILAWLSVYSKGLLSSC